MGKGKVCVDRIEPISGGIGVHPPISASSNYYSRSPLYDWPLPNTFRTSRRNNCNAQHIKPKTGFNHCYDRQVPLFFPWSCCRKRLPMKQSLWKDQQGLFELQWSCVEGKLASGINRANQHSPWNLHDSQRVKLENLFVDALFSYWTSRYSEWLTDTLFSITNFKSIKIKSKFRIVSKYKNSKFEIKQGSNQPVYLAGRR